MALLFVFCTHSTEFAASLARIGVPYRVAYAVSLTMRYLPEISRDYMNILHSQQARGVDTSKKRVSLYRRIQSVGRILVPLVISSLDKADLISSAMELRGFGKLEKRSWYNYHPFGIRDLCAFLLMIAYLVFYLFIRFQNEGLFWYPF